MAKQKTRQATNEEIIASFSEDDKALALYLRNDPVAFVKYVIGKTPHPAQVEVLKLHNQDGFHLCLPWGRQRGKTEVVFWLAAFLLFSQSNYSVFAFAPSGKQSAELFDRLTHLYATNPFLKRMVKSEVRGDTLYIGGKEWNSTVELVKVGLQGHLGRGRTTASKGLTVYDEFAQFLYSEQVRSNLSPLCISGGSEIILSSPAFGTPFHKLYETWKQLEKDNARYHVIECDYFPGHVKPEWIEDIRREHEAAGNLWYFEQEYEGRWVAPANTWFPWADVERCVLPSRPSWKRGDTFVWGCDWAGRGRSAAVIAIARLNQALSRLEVVDLRSFMFENHKYRRDDEGSEILPENDFEQIVEICCDLRETYPPSALLYDPNTERSLSGRLENVYRFPCQPVTVGGYEPKLRFLTALRKGIAEARIVWADPRITKQLSAFSPKQDETTGRYKWPETNTDIIVALGNCYAYFQTYEEMPFAVITGNRPKGGKLW